MSTPSKSSSPDPVLEITQSILAEAAQRPWLAALLMRRRADWLTRLVHLAQRMHNLPRHTRRVLRRKLTSGLAAAALLLALAGTPAAYAAGSMIVTPGAAGFTTGDGCSLAEAIINANNGDSISYPECGGASTGGNTITLPPSATFNYAAALSGDGKSALPEITSQITIEASGSTIQRSGAGTNNFRILNIASTGDLTLDQATITGGNLLGFGGGINNEGTLTVQASDIISNTTASVDGGSGGGGILSSGTLTVTNNSTLSGNTTDGMGGGILSNNSVAVQDSTISGNTAYYGGGIFHYSGTLTVTNSTLSGNTAYRDGGGIYNFGTATVQDSTLSGNTAYSYGGGIDNNGTVTVTDSTLSENLANNSGEGRAYGGAIFNQGIATVQSSSLITNTASNTDVGLAAGGAIYNNNYGTLTVQNSTISGNSTTAVDADRYARGGGVFNIGTLAMTNSTVANNNADAFSSEGGGIFGTATVSNSLVVSNTLGAVVPNDCSAPLSSGGYNIESGTSCGFTDVANGDQQNVLDTDLKLLALAGNGGPTLTRALDNGSVALEKIPEGTNGCGTVITTDQRGYARPGTKNSQTTKMCEVGAWEAQATDPTAITLRDLTATTNTSPSAIGAVLAAFAALGALVIGRRVKSKARRKA